MSHFTEMECEFEAKNEAELVKALEEYFGEGNVEYHKNGAALLGFQGDDRSTLSPSNESYAPKCEIIIRRDNVGSAANDVGYRRNKEGKYSAYISEHDQRSNFSKDKQDKVQQYYNLRVSEKALRRMGYSVKRQVEAKGVVKLIGKKY